MTRLAEVNVPRYWGFLIPGLLVVGLFDRVFVRRTVLQALLQDVAPATKELAEHIHGRQVAADDYGAEMKALNETMVTLSKRVFWLTVVASVSGVVAAIAGVAAIFA